MASVFDVLLDSLPGDIKKVIFYFIIPEPSTVRFLKKPLNFYADSYSNKYDVAFVNNKVIKNEKGEYLSRIAKKNGKHRYYATREIESGYCNECGSESVYRCCKNRNIRHDIYYNNKHLGKDRDSAFIKLMSI